MGIFDDFHKRQKKAPFMTLILVLVVGFLIVSNFLGG